VVSVGVAERTAPRAPLRDPRHHVARDVLHDTCPSGRQEGPVAVRPVRPRRAPYLESSVYGMHSGTEDVREQGDMRQNVSVCIHQIGESGGDDTEPASDRRSTEASMRALGTNTSAGSGTNWDEFVPKMRAASCFWRSRCMVRDLISAWTMDHVLSREASAATLLAEPVCVAQLMNDRCGGVP
jgi:hypothetical protein